LGCNNSNYKIDIICNYRVSTFTTPSGTQAYNYFTKVETLDPNLFVSCGRSTGDSLANLTSNEWIDNSLDWSNELGLKRFINPYGTSTGGPEGWWWDNGTSHSNQGFVAIKLVTPNGNKYGWLKLFTPTSTTTIFGFPPLELTIKEQAMNDSLNQFIRAGQVN
jgi:hypothetical protein